MKVKVYLRIGHDRRRRHTSVEANVRPNHRPITNARNAPVPTVAFGLVLDVPDELFAQAERIIAEVVVPPEAAQIAAEVKPVTT